MLFKNVANEILSVTIAIRRDISRKNADFLSDNGNQYLKEHRYKKALVKHLAWFPEKRWQKNINTVKIKFDNWLKTLLKRLNMIKRFWWNKC